MLVGILFGASLLHLIDETQLEHLSFITEIALGFIALIIGLELDFKSLKQYGKSIILIILSESFLAFFVVAIAIYFLTSDLAMGLLFGAMAPASAPAGTVAVIREYKAKGSLTKALYAVVGFDDGLAIIIFAFASTFAYNILSKESSSSNISVLTTILLPLKEIGLSIVLGIISGFLMSFIIRKSKKINNLLIIIFGSILIITGISISLHISLILTNVIAGLVIANTRNESLIMNIKQQINPIIQIMLVLFFFLAGAHLDLAKLPQLGVIGLIYIISRSVGLMGGASLGAILGGAEEKIKKFLGMGILSQAGVAIGLALIVKQNISKIGTNHATEIAISVLTIITATSIIFEIIGPILTKFALIKSGEIDKE